MAKYKTKNENATEENNQQSYKQTISDTEYDTILDKHFRELVNSSEAKTKGYNQTNIISQLQSEANQTSGWMKYMFKAKMQYNKAILSFARNDGYVEINGLNLGWMLPQFLAIGWFFSYLLAELLFEPLVLFTTSMWIAIPISIYFLYDVTNYFAGEQIIYKPLQVIYALFGLIPIIGVLPYHFRADAYVTKSMKQYINNNTKVLDHLVNKYS